MRVQRWHKRIVVAVLVPLAAAVALLVGGGASQADPGHPYLALGDSVSFGYITQAGFQYRNPDNFVGFPAYVGLALGKTVTNAACPGETTAGFISATGADNGCRPYKANFPLHTSYTGTQLAFATAFLNSHRNTKLVTVQLGRERRLHPREPMCRQPGVHRSGPADAAGNDQQQHGHDLQGDRRDAFPRTPDRCQLLLARLQRRSRYRADHAAEPGDHEPRQGRRRDRRRCVHGVRARRRAAAAGKTCAAGLLNTTPGNQTTCDVHPSQSGAELLAQAVVSAYQGNGGS